MIEKGSIIVYGNEICRVTDVVPMTLGKITRDYYVLNPVYDTKNTIYVPVDNQNLVAKMRSLLSKKEIYAVIDAAQENKAKWIDDDRERNVSFREIIEQGDRREIIGMIAAIFEHKLEVEKQGKKLHSADEILLSRAEKLIYEEIALVLNIDKEDVIPFITERIEK
jgi:CarD family transcriptional regulator